MELAAPSGDFPTIRVRDRQCTTTSSGAGGAYIGAGVVKCLERVVCKSNTSFGMMCSNACAVSCPSLFSRKASMFSMFGILRDTAAPSKVQPFSMKAVEQAISARRHESSAPWHASKLRRLTAYCPRMFRFVCSLQPSTRKRMHVTTLQ